jgi:hypothetical protein
VSCKRPTFGDIKASPSGWEEETPVGNANDPIENFEFALSGLIDRYRNKFSRRRVIEALNAQAGLLVGDAGWAETEPVERMPEKAPEESGPEDVNAADPTEAAATDPTAA